MSKRYFAAVLGLWLATGTALAAQPKDFPAEDRLRIAAESADLQARLFELNRLAAPLCPNLVQWGGGGSAHLIAAREPKDEADAKFRSLLMERFSAKPADRVFLSVPAGSPLWQAGVRPGDRLVPAEPAASAASQPAPGVTLNPFAIQERLDGIQEKLEKIRLQTNEARKLAPTYQLQYFRGEESRTTEVTALPYCAISLAVWNSESSYAGAKYQSVVITAPLLRSLDPRSALMAAAHEVAQILSGFTEVNQTVASTSLFGALLGKSGGSATNPELGRNSPDEDSLIQIDRLTVMLLDPYGLTPGDFKQFLEARAAASSWRRIPYTAARYVSMARLAALAQLQSDRAAGQGWPQPAYVPNEVFEPFLVNLAEAKKQQWLRPLDQALRQGE